MHIDKDVLPRILANKEDFFDFYAKYLTDMAWEAYLVPNISKARVYEVWGAWDHDLKRVAKHEGNLSEGLDHFKHIAHLVFWLRRMAPLIELDDYNLGLSFDQKYILNDTHHELRDLLLSSANEYFNFELGLHFIRFYELGKDGGSNRASNVAIDKDYYKTVCHFLKYKSVSPHAINLIYKSIFILNK